MDLAAYFARIGYTPQAQPDLAQLHALTRAHTFSIPFENLSPLHGQAVSLAPDAIFDKLVRQQRGGYCFEQNGLFLRVLQALGFEARSLGARVRLGLTERSEVPQRTHMLIAVVLGGQTWLTDVGFGAYSQTAALLWQPDLEQSTPHDVRRYQLQDGRWFQQARRSDGDWQDLYEFDGSPFYAADQKVANHYTSTHPDSHFTPRLMVARALPDGGRVTLVADELRHFDRQGDVRVQPIAPSQLSATLQREFGLHWPA